MQDGALLLGHDLFHYYSLFNDCNLTSLNFYPTVFCFYYTVSVHNNYVMVTSEKGL